MITKEQIGILAKSYQIDIFTIFREFLQLVFLSYLYRQRKPTKIYFKGGTAIHLLFGSPRFSEDLDFSTLCSNKEIGKILKKIEDQIQEELPEFKILPVYLGKKTIRFRIKYQTQDFKYPLIIRADFNKEEPYSSIVVSPLLTKFPLALFPLISHLSAEEILAEKVRALLTRGKGRDFFDLWFLVKKGVKIDLSLIEKKTREVKRSFDQAFLLKKIENYPLKKIRLDLAKFLPESQRGITEVLKEELLKALKEYFS